MESILIDAGRSSAADLLGWHQVQHSAHIVDRSGLSAPTVKFSIDTLRAQGGASTLARLIRDGEGAAVATLRLDVWTDPTFAYLAAGEVVVAPHERRRGLGQRITSTLIRAATELNRETLVVTAVSDGAGASFCQRAGFTQVLERTQWVLDLSCVQWPAVEAAGAAPPGYSLVAWSERCPDDVIDRYCTVLDAMRDEPTGGLDLRGGATTPAVVRSSEKSVELRHHRRHVMCAVHEASGALVAVTRVEVHDDFDEAAQGATAVIAEHRGRGLARWLKSAMLVQLAESEPHVTNIRTGTAPVNVHMRRINETLGFRPVLALAEFQRTLPREAPNP